MNFADFFTNINITSEQTDKYKRPYWEELFWTNHKRTCNKAKPNYKLIRETWVYFFVQNELFSW